ncbi:tRNA N6-adenosine threonylcarbamoyltransferase [Nitrosopumilaceae archaeon]|nr:tRNA N6-adenosine threonylcarbamoyltransferase [Nitrosopumilaceae archaeon]
MLGLGIESTAHTFSCSVMDGRGRILSDVRSAYRPPDGEGIHPREASRHHVERGPAVLDECLREAGVGMSDIGMVSYAAGPGLGPCLRVGAVMARALASYHGIPLYPVNHAVGHIEIGRLLTGLRDPLVLLVSGGHTMILAFLEKRWRVFGETLDITLGQLLDQFGRSLGFASPCGREIERLAASSSGCMQLPYVVKGNDVSFSGLLSAAVRAAGPDRALACRSLQETAFAMVSEAVERALSLTGKREVMAVGGVAANKRLAGMLGAACRLHGARFRVVPPRYAGDCGSQICWTGMLESDIGGGTPVRDALVRQSWRLDTVTIGYQAPLASRRPRSRR